MQNRSERYNWNQYFIYLSTIASTLKKNFIKNGQPRNKIQENFFTKMSSQFHKTKRYNGSDMITTIKKWQFYSIYIILFCLNSKQNEIHSLPGIRIGSILKVFTFRFVIIAGSFGVCSLISSPR